MSTLGTALALGFILGIKHALDADHVVAVSTIVSRDPRPLRSALAGMFWGIGHTLTLFVAGIVVLFFKVNIPDRVALSFEFLVGAVLVALGAQNLWDYGRTRFHTHSHESGDTHVHYHAHKKGHDHHLTNRQRKSLLVGMMHGLAGSGALVLLILGTIESPLEGAAYILIFGLGSILGMMMIGTAMALPFSLSARKFGKLTKHIQLLAGGVSVFLGALVMVQIGLLGGLLAAA
ncbi:MAG: sulfite exporter TauE/SafE family protein [Anaerolineales bacterium]